MYLFFVCRSVFTQSYDTSESVADEAEGAADISTWAGEADFVTGMKNHVSLCN